MDLIRFLKENKNSRKIFGAREIKIIEKQLLGINLTQSEKNRLSRDIRKKFDFITDIKNFDFNFNLKKGTTIKNKISEAIEIIKLDALFKNNVQFIMTSNYRPDLLYPDGLHRDRVLPAIRLLEQKLDVINVDAGVDYRKVVMDQVRAYITPLGPEVDQEVSSVFGQLAGAHNDESLDLLIENRVIHCIRRAGGIAWFDFEELCAGPRSQNDYLEIASTFHTVILTSVPKMSPRMSSEARRFTWLIDVFYDHKIKLIMTAEVEADLLYVEGQMSGEFHRTVSRIIEMQSKEYLHAPRRVVDTSLT
jgi:cell division protein ZapE